MTARAPLLILVLLLAACAPRAQLIPFPQGAEPERIRAVYVSTSRARPEGGDYSSKRSLNSGFARLDISVPPARVPGAIEVPRRDVDPQKHYLVAARSEFTDAPTFRADLTRSLRGGREAVIYVHGFNNTFAEGVLRIAQLAEDFEFPDVAVHYSWPSAGNPLGYAYDRDSVLFARDGLEQLISEVRAAGARDIVLVGHSVGSLLIMETLRQVAIARPGSVDDLIGGVVLISPDIDVAVFRSQVRRIGQLPDAFGIFVSKRDRALQLSARLTGQRNRLGNVSVEDVADLDVTVIDVTEFSEGVGHFTAGSSASVIRIFQRTADLEAAFRGDNSGRTGLLPGTVLTVQNATAIILSPVQGLFGG